MNKTISFLPQRRIHSNRVEPEKQKIRVAAYCRVSLDTEEQAGSYDIQVEHYTNYINRNPDWTLAGIFADDGISGTSTKKREAFNQMISKCMNGEIDMIITKSISRFARNTLDCLHYIRELKEKRISVYFEKENINTLDAKGEILLTIMASLAQQESESLSENVKLGLAFRCQNGEVQVNHNRFMGYTKDEDKKLIIVPEEAEIVKRIFREYLEGSSLLQIARGLERDGILTAAKMSKWRPETVKKMLQNEKYMGDALLQKTYTVDFLKKKRAPNNGEAPQYYVENDHEAIIPKELYMRVQEELVRRANLTDSGSRRVYSSKYALSSLVFCGHCGGIYRRIHWNNRGKKSVVWRCVGRLEDSVDKCPDSPTVTEQDLQGIVLKAVNTAVTDRDDFISKLGGNILLAVDSDFGKNIAEINSRLGELQEELIRLVSSKSNHDAVADEIYRLRDIKNNAFSEYSERQGINNRISEMLDFLENQRSDLIYYDDTLVRRLVEKITVNGTGFSVLFKSGLTLEI